MGISFKKPVNGAGAKEQEQQTGSETKTASSVVKSSGWFKTGFAAKQALAQEDAAAALRKQEAGKMYAFWCPENEERQITFLDGKLDDEGMLTTPMFQQHSVRINGNWEKFVCTTEEEPDPDALPCPICEKGDHPKLVGVMTIIDHSEYKIKKGPNQGKIIKNSRKLFLGKGTTMKILNKLAVKRGGLEFCTFDVSRTGENSPGVGNQFDFVQKFASRAELAAKYGLSEEDCVAPNEEEYKKEIGYRSPEQLIALGVDKVVIGVNKQGSSFSASSTSKLADEL